MKALGNKLVLFQLLKGDAPSQQLEEATALEIAASIEKTAVDVVEVSDESPQEKPQEQPQVSEPSNDVDPPVSEDGQASLF